MGLSFCYYYYFILFFLKSFVSGFEVVDKGCCGSGTIEVAVLCNQLSPFTCEDASTYVFWDSYHPTERAYKVIIDEIIQKCVDSLIWSNWSTFWYLFNLQPIYGKLHCLLLFVMVKVKIFLLGFVITVKRATMVVMS